MKVDLGSLSHFFRRTATATLLGLLLCSCSTTKTSRSYQTETFTSESPFQYYSSQEADKACEIAKRALLSQGYQVDDDKPRNIRGEKFFRPTPDEATRLTITLDSKRRRLRSGMKDIALESIYEKKSKGSNAGVSVSALGSVTLPWSIDKDTLVKVGEETVTSPVFYQRLFDLIKSLDS